MTASENREPSPFVRLHAGFQLWMLNVLLGTLVGSAWLFRLPEGLSPWTRVYVGIALFSSVAVLGILPAAAFVGANRWIRERRTLGLVLAFVAASFLGLLYTDTVIYRLLRYHFNGAVLNVALTPGAGDSIHLGWSVWGTVLVYFVIATWAQNLLWRSMVSRLERLEVAGADVHLLLRPRIIVLLLLLPMVSIEKSVYAAAHVQGDEEILEAAKPLPLVLRPRLGRLIDGEAGPLPTIEVVPDASELDYPAAWPDLPDEGPRPNVLMLVLDSWRLDMFTEELTPNLHEFARDGLIFDNHLSGGNGTRFGLFTMLYGLHGSYWFKTLERRQPPVLIETLRKAGYDIRVFSAASMNFPEFLDTAWSSLPRENVVDEFIGPDGEPISTISYVKDGLVAGAFENWMQARQRDGDTRPFFGFVLIDAPHQPYYNPGGPYQPTIETLNYIELGITNDGPELDALVERVFNTYKNSVLHADGTAGDVLGSLERSGELEDTVVVVTGDHGEEFQENGFFGHTSNFSREQVEVPFYMVGPGIESGHEHRPTSHLDISNSILELLGVDPAGRGAYSLGESLFSPPETRARVVGGWDDIGIWTPGGIFDIPLDVDADEIWVYDHDWKPLRDVAERVSAEESLLEEVARECNLFLTSPVLD